MNDGPDEPVDPTAEVVVEPEPGGPLVVRGPVRVTDADGREIVTTSAVRLCRCGRTGDAPFCDESHTAGWAGSTS